MNRNDQPRLRYGLPAALFVLALLLRLWALNWGLPYVEHPDEPAVVDIVLRMLRQDDPNPHWFRYPSLLFYVLALVGRLHVWWGVQQGLYGSLQDLPVSTHQFTVAPALYVWYRAPVALLGALTVPALYLLGRRMFDLRVGLLAGLALAVAPFHIEHSHYITTDVPTGLWVTLALLGAWGIASAGRWPAYLFAGLAAGLAAGTKYNAGAVVLALGLAHLLYWRRRSLGRPLLPLAAGAAATLLAFLASTPFALLDWPTFLADLRFNADHYASGSHGDFIGRWQIGGYAGFLWERGLMPSGCLLVLLGLLPLLQRAPRQLALLLLGVILPGLFLMLSQAVNFVRNMQPFFPALVLLAAAGALALADRLTGRLRRAALPVLALALLLPHARETGWLLRYWSQPYTLADAARELLRQPRGMLAAVELHPVQWAGAPAVHPLEQVTAHDAAWYRARGFRYLMLNSDRRTPDDRPVAARLLAAGAVIRSYPERRLGQRPGPGGALLDLGEHLEQIPFVRRELRFGDSVALLGYELWPGEPRARITPLEGADERVLAPGQPLQINLYWRALAAMQQDYTLFIHVVDQAGQRVAQRDLPLRYDDYPTSHWQPGELVIDRADMGLPALPPGEYRLELGLYDAISGAVLAPQGQLRGSGPHPVLATIGIR